MGCFRIKLKFVIVKAIQMITRFDVFNILSAPTLVQLPVFKNEPSQSHKNLDLSFMYLRVLVGSTNSCNLAHLVHCELLEVEKMTFSTCLRLNRY